MTKYDNIVPTIENEEIERVDSYKYLGKTVNMEDNTKEEILLRIKAGWSCFGRYKYILCDKTIPIALRSRMFQSVCAAHYHL